MEPTNTYGILKPVVDQANRALQIDIEKAMAEDPSLEAKLALFTEAELANLSTFVRRVQIGAFVIGSQAACEAAGILEQAGLVPANDQVGQDEGVSAVKTSAVEPEGNQ